VSELDPSQAAVLAAIIKSPSGLSPEKNLDGLKARWSYVLDGMVQQGWLTRSQFAATEFPKIKKGDGVNRLGGQTGYIMTTVQDSLQALGFDDQQIQQGGLRVVTTIDLNAQRSASAAVRKVGPQSGTKGVRIGLAAVRPGTGDIVAMYGGEDFITDQINNATHPFAQAGSTFKPFALAAATDQGIPLTTWWNGDSPSTVNGYTFSNYADKSYGQVTLLSATEESINSAYVALEDQVGVKNVADAAVKAGIPADTPGMDLKNLNLTFVLGTASPSALDMAGAYATFAASGIKAKSHIIQTVKGANDGVLYQSDPKTEAMFPKPVADTVTYALSRVVTNGTGKAALALGRPAAGKTGTTDNNLSAWFVGFTPQLAAAVLMAKEDANGSPQSLSGTGGLKTVTGGSFPAAMWTAFMKGALSGQPKQNFPDPPPGVKLPKHCPTDPMAVIPDGCPVPQIDAGLIPGIDGSLLPSGGDVAASQSPDASVVAPPLPSSAASASPSASSKKPQPPTQEARP
jgi:membrane peptidoglycan carboxypeptidase